MASLFNHSFIFLMYISSYLREATYFFCFYLNVCCLWKLLSFFLFIVWKPTRCKYLKTNISVLNFPYLANFGLLFIWRNFNVMLSYFLVKLLCDNKAQQKSRSREIEVEIEVLTYSYTFLKKTLEFLGLSSLHPWKFCKTVWHPLEISRSKTIWPMLHDEWSC